MTFENLKILAALGRNPTGTNQSLSKDVGISAQSLKNRLNQLYSQKILLGVSASVSPFAVGLEAIAVFAEVSPENWSVFEKVCDNHPYTHYRIRTFGAVNGIFALFTIPFHTTHIITDLLEKMKKRGNIQNYEIAVPTSSYITSETDFDYFDIDTGWNFNWEKWEKTLEKDGAVGLESPPPSVLQRLDEGGLGLPVDIECDHVDAVVEHANGHSRFRVFERFGDCAKLTVAVLVNSKHIGIARGSSGAVGLFWPRGNRIFEFLAATRIDNRPPLAGCSVVEEPESVRKKSGESNDGNRNDSSKPKQIRGSPFSVGGY